ncbi:piggyBac transposable element-derived protein 4-like [Ctenocephalides felis]|uniref:piggyBac transposable element-derived protein 4-like n=1 Tax=Ctenocephalides felis TaxID=7515 RepID=UPI000E6E2AC4|nr:piggyBac transposable element-derived protein 4-like [Ctenocephalides felis]
MDSDYDSEVYADNLSEISDIGNLHDFDSDSDSDNDDLFRTRRNRVMPILSSDSEESGDECPSWLPVESDRTPVIEPFVGNSGVSAIPYIRSVIDIVKLFIGDDLIEHMAIETNRYHMQNLNRLSTGGKSIKWKDVTGKDIKKMLGLLLLMGRVRKDTRDEYWSTEETISTPFFAKIMSRDRFRQIWSSWHFANNEQDVIENDRLSKVRPIINYLLPKFRIVYKPERELSLDESVMPWRGRLSFKVYNASKIVKYGILIRMVCEAKSGYICNLKIYCGNGNSLQSTILDILEPYLNLWHHVYMDNFYNSVNTSLLLLQNKTRICGTIRTNRGLPEELKNLKLKRGETVFRRRQEVLLQCWQSKRIVQMISTIHSAAMVESHNIEWKTREKIWKPICVIDYNKYMSGVDRADQYLSYFSIVRRTKKWTKRMVID